MHGTFMVCGSAGLSVLGRERLSRRCGVGSAFMLSHWAGHSAPPFLKSEVRCSWTLSTFRRVGGLIADRPAQGTEGIFLSISWAKDTMAWRFA